MSSRRTLPVARRALIGLVLGVTSSSHPTLAAAQIQSLTAEEAGNRIRFEPGVRLVLIYSTTCRPSHEMFPEVVRLSERYGPLGVRFLAFSIDPIPDDIDNYLASVGYPFERLHIQPWQPGELIAALAPSGIDVRRKVATPHIAVIDANRQLVGQWQGGWGAQKADRWLRSPGFRPAVK